MLGWERMTKNISSRTHKKQHRLSASAWFWGLSFNAGLQECLRTTNWDKHGRAGLNQHWRGVDLKHLETCQCHTDLSVPQKMIASWYALCKNNSPCFHRFRSSLRWPIVVTPKLTNWSQRVPQRPMMTAFCLPDSTAVVTFMDTPIAGGFKIGVPSGKQPHSNGKIHHFIAGQIHYFYGHFPVRKL